MRYLSHLSPYNSGLFLYPMLSGLVTRGLGKEEAGGVSLPLFCPVMPMGEDPRHGLLVALVVVILAVLLTVAAAFAIAPALVAVLGLMTYVIFWYMSREETSFMHHAQVREKRGCRAGGGGALVVVLVLVVVVLVGVGVGVGAAVAVVVGGFIGVDDGFVVGIGWFGCCCCCFGSC